MKSTIGFLRQVLDQQNEELREINDNLNEFVEKIERGNRVLEKAIYKRNWSIKRVLTKGVNYGHTQKVT